MSKIAARGKGVSTPVVAETEPVVVAEPNSPARVPILIGIVLVASISIGLLAAYLWGQFAPAGSATRGIEYTTEGEAGPDGVVNSPLQITVRLPWRESDPNSVIASVSLQMLNEAGEPARFGPTTPEGLTMKPAVEMGQWQLVGSVPSEPGRYTARLIVKRLYGNTQPETVDLKNPVLVARAETAPPLRSGYVIARDTDLWLKATDLSRERRLTYFAGTGSAAYNPRWSPNGTRIAYSFLPARPASELPRTEIWSIAADGSDARKLVEPRPDETLSHPAWTDGGNVLYISSDRLSNDGLPPGTPLEAMGEFRRIDRLDVSTGQRTELYRGAQRPVTSRDGNKLLYVEDAPPLSEGGSPEFRLVIVEGRQRRVLVEAGKFPRIQSPAISPDGKWVALASYEAVAPDKDTYDFWDWLLFRPKTARAHDAPWDIYILPAAGGQARKLTSLAEDEPSTDWISNESLAFLGERNLYQLFITANGEAAREPIPIDKGVDHGELSWHAP
jgi:hypothetical protein